MGWGGMGPRWSKMVQDGPELYKFIGIVQQFRPQGQSLGVRDRPKLYKFIGVAQKFRPQGQNLGVQDGPKLYKFIGSVHPPEWSGLLDIARYRSKPQ